VNVNVFCLYRFWVGYISGDQNSDLSVIMSNREPRLEWRGSNKKAGESFQHKRVYPYPEDAYKAGISLKPPKMKKIKIKEEKETHHRPPPYQPESPESSSESESENPATSIQHDEEAESYDESSSSGDSSENESIIDNPFLSVYQIVNDMEPFLREDKVARSYINSMCRENLNQLLEGMFQVFGMGIKISDEDRLYLNQKSNKNTLLTLLGIKADGKTERKVQHGEEGVKNILKKNLSFTRRMVKMIKADSVGKANKRPDWE